jgi:hypothetical protein
MTLRQDPPMTRPGTSDQPGMTSSLSDDGGSIPASLKAEYDELFLKREQLRAELERARAELAGLRMKGKAHVTGRS